MILEVSYIPNGAGLDRHQQYDLRDRKFESGNWQKYPKIGKTDDVLTLPDVKVALATTDMPSPKQCMSYIKKRWIPPMKSCLVKRWISMKGYNDPCTNPPHSRQSQDVLFLLEGWNNCQSQPDFSAATLHWFHLENGLHQSTSIWHNEIQM